jgi:hypothetical protein
VLYSYSSPEVTRVITVDENARVQSFEFTSIEDGRLEGVWRSGGSGELSCSTE